MKKSALILIVVSCFLTCFGQNSIIGNNNFEKQTTDYLPKIASLVVSKDTTENIPQSPENIEKSYRRINPPNIALSPGVIFQKQTFGEINLLIGRYESEMSGNAFGGVRLGAETNFQKGNEHIWASKIGVEFSGMVFCLRATTLCYMSGLNSQWRFLPEIGISFLGFANLTYGYNFKLTGDPINGIINHRVCLSLNLNPWLMGDVFGF